MTANTTNTNSYTTRTGRRRIAQILGGSAVVAALALSSGVAHADDSGTGAAKQARLQKVCAKVPSLETRVATAITRLQGDASVKGSLAALQAQIDKATAAGRTQAVAALQNRLSTRTKTLAVLQDKQQRLVLIAQTCADQGLGA
ncbi:MAG: hypothetical protein RLZZ362_1417 [Actinomycetota bacterium]|jgi:hypothetical protein